MIFLSSSLLYLLAGCVALRFVWPIRSVPFRPVLSAPIGRVVAGQDDVRNPRGDARRRKSGRDWLHVAGLIVTRRRGRERSRSLDHCPVVFQPLAVIEGDGCDDAAPAPIGGGEATLFDGALCNDDFVAEGAHADALDVDAELA